MNVLLKPMLTEKSYQAQAGEAKKYYFLANPKANKTLIRLAFKAIYGVAADEVNVIVRKPAKTKTGTARPGFTKLQKIAIITLPAGVEIMVTGEKVDEPKDKDKSKKEEKSEKE